VLMRTDPFRELERLTHHVLGAWLLSAPFGILDVAGYLLSIDRLVCNVEVEAISAVQYGTPGGHCQIERSGRGRQSHQPHASHMTWGFTRTDRLKSWSDCST
jgi:hypothetical protein